MQFKKKVSGDRKLNLNDIMRVKFDYENITTHTMMIKEKKRKKIRCLVV